MLPYSKSRAHHEELMNRYADEARRDRNSRDGKLDGVARVAEAIADGLASLGKGFRRSVRERTV
jgi:hypothetical protein